MISFFFHFSNESVLVAIGAEISTHSLLHGRNIIFRRKASSANCLSQDPNLTQEWLFLICQWTRTFALIDMWIISKYINGIHGSVFPLKQQETEHATGGHFLLSRQETNILPFLECHIRTTHFVALCTPWSVMQFKTATKMIEKVYNILIWTFPAAQSVTYSEAHYRRIQSKKSWQARYFAIISKIVVVRHYY